MIPKNTDLRHVHTRLSQFEIHEACNESAKLKEIEAQKAALGVKYVLHPDNAPAKGIYNNQGTRLQ